MLPHWQWGETQQIGCRSADAKRSTISRAQAHPRGLAPTHDGIACLAPAPLLAVRNAADAARSSIGGEGGIRTLGTGLPYTRLAGVHLRPLGHLSEDRQRPHSTAPRGGQRARDAHPRDGTSCARVRSRTHLDKATCYLAHFSRENRCVIHACCAQLLSVQKRGRRRGNPRDAGNADPLAFDRSEPASPQR